MFPHARQATAVSLLAGLMLTGTAAAQDAVPAPEAAPAPTASPAGDARIGQFLAQLEADRAKLRIPGLSYAVIENGAIVRDGGLGLADVEKGVRATADTPYHIGSVTKTFTAVLALRLAAKNKLDLDAPVSTWAPQVADGRVRVKHLLSHTSGGTPGDRFAYDPDR